MVQGRPRKTQEELDAEMADYWGKGSGVANATNGTAEASAAVANDDIDMIE